MGRTTYIYKICDAGEWRSAERDGVFTGSRTDLVDGFLHFSTAHQVAETARLHFAATGELVLIAVRVDALGAPLKWERSRRGAFFPHLYGVLPTSAVSWVKPLPRDQDGHHLFPPLEPEDAPEPP